ncbi:hypothetical protein [Halogeometricum limi]|uniref:Uncharacterized protein n=1 Tax=Halogeometricum limi TaxID=555875 RepID=A0A1I6IDR5_9EURY|nr:hypothetical protein [Halogeometricum limi]SFR64872.1 hypothetical protein SAMN04488124_3108 [Halogeometricum limi]
MKREADGASSDTLASFVVARWRALERGWKATIVGVVLVAGVGLV